MSTSVHRTAAAASAGAAAAAPQAQVEAQMLDDDDGFEQLLDWMQEDGKDGGVACQSSLDCRI